MKRLFALREHQSSYFGRCALIVLGGLWLCFGSGALAQSAAAPARPNAPFSTRATHLLGLPDTKRNCNGTLSIEDNALQFRLNGKPEVPLDIASVLHLSLGEESKQVGGLPMTIGKAAAPYGGGRVVSLIAHKKYDTLTLEYADKTGGLHGAIFQMKKGQGELVRNQLVARGVSSSPGEDQSAKQSHSEVTHGDK
jgi:hypothetical protein